MNENSQCSDYQDCLSKKAHQCSSICPSFEYLINEKITTNVNCIVPNCGETFSNLSVLNFHLKKVHRIDQTNQTDELLLTRAKSKSQKMQDNCNCKYYCPVEKCKFYFGCSNSLPTFHSLKNHFIRMHGNKSYNCTKCNRSFGIKSEMQRHLETCGLLFKCPTCECPYATKSSLMKHLRKKNHGTVTIETKKPELIKQKSQEIKTRTNVRIAPALPAAQSHNQAIILIQIDSNNNYTNNQEKLNDADDLQRSFGCQTQIDNSNITQETACQTIQYCTHLNIDANYDRFASNSTSTEMPDNGSNFQSQETQTFSLINADDEYINMILADISTQTHEYSNQTTESFKSCSIQTSEITLNTTCTQTNQETNNQIISNLELANLDEIYFNDDNNKLSYYDTNQANYDYSTKAACQTCQTDDFYFSNANTNSIQTQTSCYFNDIDTSGVNDSRYTDTITQTDWNLDF